MRNNRRQLGVTLTEMTIVVAIAALMVGLTIPAANMLLNSFESENGAKSIISSAMASARAMAAKEQRYAGIRFQKRYDPNNPDPLNESQYIIFITNEKNRNLSGNLTNGFRAVEGMQPIKLPDSIGVMDLIYDQKDITPPGDGQIDIDTEIADWNIIRDTTAFSIIFSPSGKLVIHDVRVRNRDGYTASTTNPLSLSNDNIFNRISQIEAGYGMFLQDDYYADYQPAPGNPKPPNLGFGPEFSRNSFIIYDTKKFKQAYNNGNAYSGYLNQLNRFYINPYTGTIINEK